VLFSQYKSFAPLAADYHQNNDLILFLFKDQMALTWKHYNYINKEQLIIILYNYDNSVNSLKHFCFSAYLIIFFL